jgi:hypothetical protein
MKYDEEGLIVTEEKELEVVVAFDQAYGSIGYYMRLPRSSPIAIQAVEVPLKNFIFDDGFDYGTERHYCGGYNLSGDCIFAAEIFDQHLNVDEEACVEYWGSIRDKNTGIEMGHEVYYDYNKGYAGGQIDNVRHLSISEVLEILRAIGNRLIASIGIRMTYNRIVVLPVTKLVAEIEANKVSCFMCNSLFSSFEEYYSHKCKGLAALQKCFDEIENASTNKEKKESLEQLAVQLVKTTEGLEISKRDARGLDSEVDVIVINECRQPSLEMLATPFLIECRNWDDPMPAKAIRDFGGKLRDRRIQTGVIISLKGVTGSEKTDAKEAIRNLLTRDNINILVFDEKDITKLVRGAKFGSMLREKYYDIKSY